MIETRNINESRNAFSRIFTKAASGDELIALNFNTPGMNGRTASAASRFNHTGCLGP